MARAFAEAQVSIKGDARLIGVEGKDPDIEALDKHVELFHPEAREAACEDGLRLEDIECRHKE